jgi:hypothetical protein
MGTQPPIAAAEIEQVRRTSLLAEAQATSGISGDILKWTLTSLLVVNGGALVALIGANDLRAEAFQAAAFYFGGGMLSALVGGVCWAAALGFFAADALRRAWDPTPITASELGGLKTQKVTERWGVAALITWLVSFGLFAAGCIETAFVPQSAELSTLGAEHREAAARASAEAESVIRIMRDKRSSAEQKQAALDRFRAAEVEVRIRESRLNRALGDPDRLIDETQNSMNLLLAQ